MWTLDGFHRIFQDNNYGKNSGLMILILIVNTLLIRVSILNL
jgi:hypothetical protein